MPIVTLKELKALLPPKSRVLGLDHAQKAIGVALSNPELTMATPLAVLTGKKFTENLEKLKKLSAEYEARGFIIGLPLNIDGSEGKRCEQVRSFAQNLIHDKNTLGFDPLIAFYDERLTTHAAEQLLIEEVGMSAKRRSEVIDKMAAQIILQSALDSIDK